VVVGALAVAVTLFVVTHRQFALFEATHDSFWRFMMDVLPVIWLFVFALMVGVGVYEFRHTKRGYKYPLWQIFASSMVLSLVGGAALQLFGFGYATDHMLGERMGMYNSQEKVEKRLWQNPEDGRLLGRQTERFIPPATVVGFTDVAGDVWSVDVTDLTPQEVELLNKEEHVRLIGVLRDEKGKQFHSCGVFPWLLDKPMSRGDLSAARKAFETKVHGFEEKIEHAIFEEQQKTNGAESPCLDIIPKKRIETE
jgi:hypothetical protein